MTNSKMTDAKMNDAKKTDPFYQFCQRPLSEFHFAQEIYHCEKKDSIKDVVKGMAFNNIGCVVIMDQKKPIGIFTERDMLKRVYLKITDIEKQKIDTVMTPNPVCVQDTTSLKTVLEGMKEGRFRHMVVVNDKKEATGVISIKDVLGAISSYFEG